MQGGSKAIDIVGNSRMDHVEVEGCERSSLEDCTNSTNHDEIHMVLCKDLQDCEEIRRSGWHRVYYEPTGRTAAALRAVPPGSC